MPPGQVAFVELPNSRGSLHMVFVSLCPPASSPEITLRKLFDQFFVDLTTFGIFPRTWLPFAQHYKNSLALAGSTPKPSFLPETVIKFNANRILPGNRYTI